MEQFAAWREKGRIDRLVRVAAADIAGRPPRRTFPEALGCSKGRELKVRTRNQTYYLGRHLIERAFRPVLNCILEQCFEEQLEGTFKDLKVGYPI